MSIPFNYQIAPVIKKQDGSDCSNLKFPLFNVGCNGVPLPVPPNAAISKFVSSIPTLNTDQFKLPTLTSHHPNNSTFSGNDELILVSNLSNLNLSISTASSHVNLPNVNLPHVNLPNVNLTSSALVFSSVSNLAISSGVSNDKSLSTRLANLVISEIDLVHDHNAHNEILIEPRRKRRWIHHQTYWESITEQRSTYWHQERFCRLTASNLASACGMSSFSTPADLALDITGIKKKVIDEASRKRMDFGTEYEPAARDWFERKYNLTVEEKGLCVPKWQLLMGSSSDGEVKGESAIIEVKCPDGDVYKALQEYNHRKKMGWIPPIHYNTHIWTSHYLQMQMNMKVTGRNQCYYIVFCPKFDNVFVDTVLWNPDYWSTVIEPKTNIFINDYLKPLIQNYKLESKIIYPSEDQYLDF